MVFQQQDSIVVDSSLEQADSGTVHHAPLTPAQVISWLPRDATPAQQDSAIHAHFKPSEIHWSERPDTLHLPGHDKGHNLMDVQLPQYYREGFFSKDTLFHPELPGGRAGVAGDPVPYTVHHDNIITLLLLACFIIAIVSVARMRYFFIQQFKRFFYPTHEATASFSETTYEFRVQIFLVGVAALLLSLIYYFYTIEFVGETFVLSSQYYLILIYLAMMAGYFLLKAVLYAIVNVIFFDGKRNGQWLKTFLFIISVEGILLFPLVLLITYSTLSVQNVLIYLIVVLIFVKFLTIYKTYNIFFRQNVVRLQIILYFCALEIVPMLSFWGLLAIMTDSLKINY